MHPTDVPFDATFWAAVGAIVMALGALGAVLVQAMRQAYKQGQTDQLIKTLREDVEAIKDVGSRQGVAEERLKTLEAAQAQTMHLAAAVSGLQAAVGALNATMDGYGRSIDRLDGILEDIGSFLRGAVERPPQRQRRRTDEAST